MSALMSGACILFLFWSITHLVRKLIITDENNITKGQLITVMGSGLIGALVYTFSDTFWFSAVEGEVYAFSSLFTAVVFWLNSEMGKTWPTSLIATAGLSSSPI